MEANPSSACISVDSSFQLSQGQAVFPGSICAPIASLQLRFSVVSDGGVNLTTGWTPTFTVTGIYQPMIAEGYLSLWLSHVHTHTNICTLARPPTLAHTTTTHNTHTSHTGEFRIASIYPIFAEVNTDLFTAAAVDLVNKGVWEPSFSREPVGMICNMATKRS